MLSENIRKYRVLAGLSQDELAKKMRMSRVALSRWENDQDDPQNEQLVRLAETLGISVDALLADDVLPENRDAEKLDSARCGLGTATQKLEAAQTTLANLVERQIAISQKQFRQIQTKRRNRRNTCLVILSGIIVMILIYLAFVHWANKTDTDHPKTSPPTIRVLDDSG